MSLADVTSARSSPTPEACPECDTSASVTSDLHKYQVACTCKPPSVQYACATEPGPPPPAKTDAPPALPPRPPASVLATNRRTNAAVGCPAPDASCRRRKYAWWCVGCGALVAALGGLLAAQHIVLRAFTASPQHLETVPAAVPAAMLVLTGVCIMSLARRRNRYSSMVRKIKIVGACCLVCALTCVLVTITTTVIHMNKLQTLKYCDYTARTRSCACSSLAADQPRSTDDGEIRCVFEGVTNCDVIHGPLLWCLRGVFALSVTAVLVCIFSCMLAYQLLSHERKKMYWEQLELRCRSLYRPPPGPTPARPVQSNCSCCTQCHPAPPAWDISLQHRFWAPGRIGNLYSPNPGAGRKTSAWSWFPWPRSSSQNSRCRMGVPQSGDSAYGFCDSDTPQNPQTPYEERQYPSNYQQQYRQNGNFPSAGNFPTAGNFPQTGNFPSTGNFTQAQYSPEGFGEASGSFDATTGVWGPPPPYSPQGRSGSRHHLHQDPATATLLHHHIDVHRNSAIHDHQPIQNHTCRNSYMLHNMAQTEISRLNPIESTNRLNPELNRLNQERLNPELAHLAQMYSPEDIARLQVEMARLGEGRFNTLRGHLVPYRGCQRLGLSSGNLHRDCRMEDNVAIECSHQKNGSKVSEQSSDSGQKLGKENLGFTNDKSSPVRASMQDCHRGVIQNAESEVYFADVSSCCNVSVKADCCMNHNVSGLVGTIESHPESTSESEGSFTLTRTQRPQPQVCSKRRSRQDKQLKVQEKLRQEINTSIRLTEQQIEQLNNSMRLNDRVIERMNERHELSDSRDRLERNDSRDRLNERIERLNEVRAERLNDSRCDRMNESRTSGMMDRMNDSRMSERMNESRTSAIIDRINDSRLSERLNESRPSGIIDRMNDSRLSERLNDSRPSGMIERMNESRISERMNDSRPSGIIDRLNDSRLSERGMNERMEDRRMSDLNSSIRLEGSPKLRSHISPLRLSKPKSPEFYNLSPISPSTDETVVSDDERQSKVYQNDAEPSKCLAPDSQYETVRENKELKTNHLHCYSDTNTMDSGWQSGSEKQVTD